MQQKEALATMHCIKAYIQ